MTVSKGVSKLDINLPSNYKVACYGGDFLEVSETGFIQIHEITNYQEWSEDYEDNVEATTKVTSRLSLSAYQARKLAMILETVWPIIDAQEIKNHDEYLARERAKAKPKAKKKTKAKAKPKAKKKAKKKSK